MTQTGLAIIDDGGGIWGPMTDLRAVFDLRTGALTTRRRIERVHNRAADALIVPKPLEDVAKQNNPGVAINTLPAQFDYFIVVNGRAVDSRTIGQAPHIAREALQQCISTEDFADVSPDGATLIERPWDIFSHFDDALRGDLGGFDLPQYDGTSEQIVRQGDHELQIAPGAKVHAMVVFNTELGPVVIDDGAIIGSFAVIAGPCYIGPQTIVAPHTHLRSFTSIGPHCVVAGEVSWSIMHSRSNKSHAGYLGHSLVGQWVNLGADTNVSNLKNTYGSIRMQLSPAPGSAPQDTGHIKLGPIIGDYVRTGIGCRLGTGSCVGTGSMIALSGLVPKYVDRFRFITDTGDKPYDIDKFIATARTVMGRRDCQLDDATAARLGALAQ